MEVECSLCNQHVVAGEESSCSLTRIENLVEGSVSVRTWWRWWKEQWGISKVECKNTVSHIGQCGIRALWRHKAMPGLYFAAHCFHTARDIKSRLCSAEWDRWYIRMTRAAFPLNPCMSLTGVLLQSNWRVKFPGIATNLESFKCFWACT